MPRLTRAAFALALAFIALPVAAQEADTSDAMANVPAPAEGAAGVPAR